MYCRACPYLVVYRCIYIYIGYLFITQKVHGRFFGLDLKEIVVNDEEIAADRRPKEPGSQCNLRGW